MNTCRNFGAPRYVRISSRRFFSSSFVKPFLISSLRWNLKGASYSFTARMVVTISSLIFGSKKVYVSAVKAVNFLKDSGKSSENFWKAFRASSPLELVYVTSL